MKQIIQLFGYLILTFIGFVLPILAILISLFPDGIKKLTLKYENEKSKNEKNLKDEIEKKEKDRSLNIEAIEKTINTLKHNKRTAEEKLSYLNPHTQLLRISIPLMASLVGVSVALLSSNIYVIYIAFASSLLFFAYIIYVLWKLLGVVTEVSRIINEDKASSDNKIIELLSTLVEKSPGTISPFLNPEKIFIKFNDKIIEEGIRLSLSINKKHQLPIAIVNSDEIMAKNVEIGFIFPLDFVVEKTKNIASIYTGKTNQIVRFEQKFIQSHETNERGDLNITFLKLGAHNVDTFIKGENIKRREKTFVIEIVN